MEINKTKQTRKAEVTYSELAVARVSHSHLCFGRDSKAGRAAERLYGGERESFGWALVGGHWHGEAVGG